MSIRPDQNQKRVSIRQSIRPSKMEGDDKKRLVNRQLLSTVKNRPTKKKMIQTSRKTRLREVFRLGEPSTKKEKIE